MQCMSWRRAPIHVAPPFGTVKLEWRDITKMASIGKLVWVSGDAATCGNGREIPERASATKASGKKKQSKSWIFKSWIALYIHRRWRALGIVEAYIAFCICRSEIKKRPRCLFLDDNVYIRSSCESIYSFILLSVNSCQTLWHIMVH